MMPGNLPDGWERRRDSSSGQYYYADHNTGTTHWDLPVHRQPSVVVAAARTVPIATVVKTPGVVKVTTVRRSTASAALPTAAPVAVALPGTVRPPPSQASNHRTSVSAVRVTKPVVARPLRALASDIGRTGAPLRVTVKAKPISASVSSSSGTSTTSTSTSSFSSSRTSLNSGTNGTTLYEPVANTSFPPYAYEQPIPLDFDNMQQQQKKGLKGLTKSFKAFTSDLNTPLSQVRAERVTLNGYYLSMEQVRWLAVNFKVRMRDDTHYWYDRSAGYLGKVGERTKHYVDPNLPVKGILDPRVSCGDSRVFLNGREIPASECVEFRMWGMPFRAGSRFTVGGNGDIHPEGFGGRPLYNWREQVKQMQEQVVETVQPGSNDLHYGVQESYSQSSNIGNDEGSNRKKKFFKNMINALERCQEHREQQEDQEEMMEQIQQMSEQYQQMFSESSGAAECIGAIDGSSSSYESLNIGLSDPTEGGLFNGEFIQGFYESGLGGLGSFLGFS